MARTYSFAMLAALAPSLAGGPSLAERAGVATAVNTETRGTPPGDQTRQIVLGQDVLHNEVIETDAAGQAQLLMLDRTALTIGPNSSLVIDRFIYDPGTGAGELSLTLRRGLLRFTGGETSKKQAVGIHTPVATIGIRGGIALVQVPDDGTTHAAVLFGDAMTVEMAGALVTQFSRPGFGTTVTGEGATPPRRWDLGRVQTLMQALQGQEGRTGGLERLQNAAGLNAAAAGSLPRQDAAALRRAMDRMLAATAGLENAQANRFFTKVPIQRAFNRPERRTEPPPVIDKHPGKGWWKRPNPDRPPPSNATGGVRPGGWRGKVPTAAN
jgi:hypothetical protein